MATDWQRSQAALSTATITALIVGTMYWARSVFIPIALAIFLTFVLSPIVVRLQRRGLGRTVAVVVTVGLVCLISVGIGSLLTVQIADLASTLPDNREAIKAKVVAVKHWAVGNENSRFVEMFEELSNEIVPNRKNPNEVVVVASSPSFAAQFDAWFSPATEALGQAAFTFILTIFMLLKREDLRNRAIQLLGGGKVTTTTKAVDDASQRISRYLLRQLILNSLFGVVIAIGLFALGVQNSLLWGTFAVLFRYVPYIGTWIGLAPPVLFSIATAPAWGNGWGQPLSVLALYLGLELICNNAIEPKLYGRSMGLSEVAQLVAAAIWAFLWGPIGLILSGPLTVCLLVLGRHVTRFKFLVVCLGDEPALPRRVAFYQRLAARDQDEAAEIAFVEASENGRDAAFDEVVVPALCLARHDAAAGELESVDLEFAVRAVGEIAVEIAELHPEPQPSEPTTDDRARLLICPSRDETEHATAEMFALTLDSSRWEVTVAGTAVLASELIALVEEKRPEVVVIVAMPPGGIAHARYLLTRLRKQLPNLNVIVARWGFDESLDTAKETILQTDGVDRTLSETRKRLTDLRALLPTQNRRSKARVPESDAIGTVNA